MISVVGGLLAALLWGASGAAAAHSSRVIGAASALAWVYVVGLVVSLPAALLSGRPDFDGRGAAATALAAPLAVSSLYVMYAALRRGPVALVMPIVASQGGVAALLAVATGEALETPAAIGLGVVMGGMYAAMRPPRGLASGSYPKVAVALAALCALLSGLALVATARAAAAVGPLWILAALRLAGVLAVTLPVAAKSSLGRPGKATAAILFSGVSDTVAFASYAIAAGGGSVAVAAVLASQFAAVSALIGVVRMGERLTRLQTAGIVAILAGVALVTVAQT